MSFCPHLLYFGMGKPFVVVVDSAEIMILTDNVLDFSQVLYVFKPAFQSWTSYKSPLPVQIN